MEEEKKGKRDYFVTPRVRGGRALIPCSRRRLIPSGIPGLPGSSLVRTRSRAPRRHLQPDPGILPSDQEVKMWRALARTRRAAPRPTPSVLWLCRQVPNVHAGFYCLSTICLNFSGDVGPHQIQQRTVFRRPRRPAAAAALGARRRMNWFNRDSWVPGKGTFPV